MQPERTGLPIQQTALAPRQWWLPAGFGLILVLIGIAYVLLGSLVEGETGHARILTTAEDSARISVLDGPQPAIWTVGFFDAGSVSPGEVHEVRLRGACGCEPYPEPGSLSFLLVGAGFFGVMFVVTAFVARANHQVRTAQLRSLAVARLGTPVTPVVTRATFSDGSIRKVRLWIEVLDAATGASFGWLDIRRARPAFDPASLDRLVGAPVVGADVALATADGSALAFAAGPLRTEHGAEARWSSLVVQTLGWAPAPARNPVVGGDGRLSVAATRPPVATDLAEAVRLRRTMASARTRLVVLYLVCLAAVFFVPVPWNLPVVLAVLGLFLAWTLRQLGPVRAAVRTAAPELGRREVNVVSALLIALGNDRNAPAA